MTLLVEDVEAAREGREQFEPASLSDAASQLSTFGVVILRNVFDPQQIRPRRQVRGQNVHGTAGLGT